MDFTSKILFFFGAVGVFNSILVSLYFLILKRPRLLSNTLFGFFLLFLSERALRSLIYFFSDISPNVYSTLGPISFLFIGPFLLLYVLSVLYPKGKAIAWWKYHVLFWLIVAIGLHLVYPFRSDPLFYKKYILKAINIQWFAYIVIAAGVVLKNLLNSPKKEKFKANNLWLCLLLLSVAVLWLIYFFVSIDYFVIGSITFSVFFYSFFLLFVFKKKLRDQIFQNRDKYADRKIDTARAMQLTQQLESILREQKLYKNPNLKSSDLAEKLNISTHQFSQLLNDNLKKSFSVFISEYRIEEAKQLIQSNTRYTLDAIGNESGFNSKSTFYTTFKRIVGMTPARYKEQF